MRTLKFIELHLKKDHSISKQINEWNYDSYMQLAALTMFAEYNCDFDKYGVCQKYRHGGFDGYNPEKMAAKTLQHRQKCCCGACRPSIGYLRTLPAVWRFLQRYAELFDEKTGFWRQGQGCSLPRSMRSETCLTHHCIMREKMPKSIIHLHRCLKGREGSLKINSRRKFNYDSDLIKYLSEWLNKEKKSNKLKKGRL